MQLLRQRGNRRCVHRLAGKLVVPLRISVLAVEFGADDFIVRETRVRISLMATLSCR
jgi:hypothetical protein